MLRLIQYSNHETITLIPSRIPPGGEGTIYYVPDNLRVVAKVYHNPSDAHARKLLTMLANPPSGTLPANTPPPITWPVDLLRSVDSQNRIVGFLMPRLSGMYHIIDLYTPQTRNKICPQFNYLYLHRTARNLAAAFHALHVRDYVVGDVKESNILVTNTALVSLVDADSFQVRNGTTIYRCPVHTPEYTPPELQGKSFSAIDRTPLHDLFGLAVIIFQLLMEGVHPFQGKYTGHGEPSPIHSRILLALHNSLSASSSVLCQARALGRALGSV